MKRKEIVLAAMAPANGKLYSPIQVQKLLFLVDREAAEFVGGQHFDFQPYNYGPFDKEVYEVLGRLDTEGMARISYAGWDRSYSLTPIGQKQGEIILNQIQEPARKYISVASEFVRKLGFRALVSAIYENYPEMRENSVLRTS